MSLRLHPVGFVAVWAVINMSRVALYRSDQMSQQALVFEAVWAEGNFVAIAEIHFLVKFCVFLQLDFFFQFLVFLLQPEDCRLKIKYMFL